MIPAPALVHCCIRALVHYNSAPAQLLLRSSGAHMMEQTSRPHGSGPREMTTRSDDSLAALAPSRTLSGTLRYAMWTGLAVVSVYLAATAVRVYERKYYVFLPDYVRWSFTPSVASVQGPTHVFFLYVDHFEPAEDEARTRRWNARYAALADRHHDSAGRPPQHTWFFPGEQQHDYHMKIFQQMAAAGYGEVELHYHHNFDTSESLRPKLESAIEFFQQFGFLKTVDGQTRFGFIHGNFGLDNSNGPAVCGVNREIALLAELGCFADYSFPSIYEDSQPPFVNTLYDAEDDDRPKSYDRRLPIEARESRGPRLMIFQGPLVFYPSWNVRQLFVTLEDGNIHASVPVTPRRIDQWVRANIHVPQRPDWVFIKVWGHAASGDPEEEEAVGPDFDAALTYLETHYNDGARYALHYVTAREAYNLAKAAAAGKTGDPGQYLNWVVKPYLADGPYIPPSRRLVSQNTPRQ
jgi:hypothetical protein